MLIAMKFRFIQVIFLLTFCNLGMMIAQSNSCSVFVLATGYNPGSQDVNNLALSDDVYVTSSPGNSMLPGTLNITTTSPALAPTTLEFIIESKAFNPSNDPLTQNVFFYNYVTATFEFVAESLVFPDPVPDNVSIVVVGGDLSRFVDPGTNTLEAMIIFETGAPNQIFAGRVDFVRWSIGGNFGPDTDMDGICDSDDLDDDNDGVEDGADPNALDPSICGDSDNDTCDDCAATSPTDFARGSNVDVDNDGPDGDADGICDAGDTCPLLPGQIGDPCDDGNDLTERDIINDNCECRGPIYIPTLSQWGMILLSLLALIFGILVIKGFISFRQTRNP
jgi:hypothetical protein